MLTLKVEKYQMIKSIMCKCYFGLVICLCQIILNKCILFYTYRSYTCEFVKKIDEPKLELYDDIDDDIDDEPIESIRQDENFSKFIYEL